MSLFQSARTITFGVICGTVGIIYEKYRISQVSAASPLPDNFYNPPPTVPETPSTLKPQNATKIMRFGYPSFDTLQIYNDFVLSYDRRTRSALWVFEHLTAEKIATKSKADRSSCEFMEDNTVHEFFRATNKDYRKSGYDRGHLAAAGNHKLSQLDCDQTFILSNIAPQVGVGFNRGKWNKLEKYTRKLTKKYSNVYVCTGPLFLPKKESDGKTYVKYEVIGRNHVAVPTHFFKVIVGESHNHYLDLESYILPNKAINDGDSLQSFQVPIEAIERAAGFLLFDKIPKKSFRRIN